MKSSDLNYIYSNTIPNQMKIKFTFFVLASLFSADCFAQSLNWSSEVIVASGSTYGYTRPRIAVASGNVPVVMWGGGAAQPLYAARWNGTSFNMPSTLTPTNVDPFIDTWAGSDIAANGNNVFVVFKRQPEMSSNIYTVKSTDGGATWSDTTRVDGMNGPYSRFPSIAVSSAGNPAVMFMTFDNLWGTPEYAVTNSTNGGTSFPMPVTVSGLGSSEVCDCCPGYLDINGNNQVAAWRRNNNNMRDIWAGVSTNSGMSFSTGLDVDNTNWMISACPSTGPDPYLWNDSLVTVFMSESSGDPRIIINSHNITTQQNGYTAMLSPNVASTTTQNYPFIAGNGDTIAVVWQENNSGNVDTYFSWSTTGSTGLLASATILNSSTAGTQQNPHVAYANGTFHFVFTDVNSGNVIYKSATINPTAVEESENLKVIRTFPNPSNGSIVVDLSLLNNQETTVRLSDASGRIVDEFFMNGENQLIIPAQAAGIYFVEVLDETGTFHSTRVVFY